MTSTMRRLAAAAVSAAAARAATSFIQSRPELFHSWERQHSDGSPVSLTEGIAASVGVLSGLPFISGRAKLGAAVAVASASYAGYIDDHREDDFEAQGKGLVGHLGALKEGKVTTGVLKIAVIGAGSAIGTLFLERTGRSRTHRLVQWGAQTVLTAGSANLINLLDLRPGRAMKASVAAAFPALFSVNPVQGETAAASLGAIVACAPEDLCGETMLGDMGANAVGAGLGFSIAAVHNRVIRLLALGDVIGLTVLSEKFSFTEIIEKTPWLNRLDQLGRS